MTGEPLDYLTVLTTKGRLATKPLATKRITHTPGGFVVEPYGRAQQFEMQEWGVSSIDDLARVLRTLERHFDSCIIRGRPKPGTHCFSAKRRVRDRRNPDGTVTPATIEPAARQWIALDCDRMACPDWIDPVFEPDRTVEYVVSRLPAEFHDATCWWPVLLGGSSAVGYGVEDLARRQPRRSRDFLAGTADLCGVADLCRHAGSRAVPLRSLPRRP